LIVQKCILKLFITPARNHNSTPFKAPSFFRYLLQASTKPSKKLPSMTRSLQILKSRLPFSPKIVGRWSSKEEEFDMSKWKSCLPQHKHSISQQNLMTRLDLLFFSILLPHSFFFHFSTFFFNSYRLFKKIFRPKGIFWRKSFYLFTSTS